MKPLVTKPMAKQIVAMGGSWLRHIATGKKLAVAAVLILSGCGESPVPPPPNVVVIGYTGSMRPTFTGGEIRPVIPTPYESLEAGEVVLHYFDNGWKAHRLVSLSLGRWKTRGDATNVPDPHLMTERTYGGTIRP